MIYIKNFKTLGPLSQYNEVWAVVRSAKNLNPGIKQVADLSPSTKLFHEYLNLRNNGNWNQKTFAEIYLPTFLHELKENSAVVNPLLNYLYNADKKNKKIALVCFCDNESTCHRSIIAGLLQGVGSNISCSTDYSAYYNQYKSIA